MSAGARVEIVEVDHEVGSTVVPTNVRVNGVDVGPLTSAPKIGATEGGAVTVTLVLLPSVVEIKGDDVRVEGRPIGFAPSV